MKKIIKRFWGVGLIVIILSSMLVIAAPAVADDNEWMAVSSPSAITYVLKNPSDVTDIAVYGTGSTVYATAGDAYVYKSTNGGSTWAKTTGTTALTTTPNMIAVAPDNVDRIAIVNTATNAVQVSVNGGVTFSAISPITSIAGTSNFTAGTIKGLAVSATRLGANYVTICGIDDDGSGVVFYYNLAP
jgi:hypothetical protein